MFDPNENIENEFNNKKVKNRRVILIIGIVSVLAVCSVILVRMTKKPKPPSTDDAEIMNVGSGMEAEDGYTDTESADILIGEKTDLAFNSGIKETNAPNSAGYLPARIEEISAGGIIPKGCEAEDEINPGNYPMESFWGRWVPESEASSRKTFNVNTAVYVNEKTGEKGEPYNIKLKAFPKELAFHPPWISVNTIGFLPAITHINQESEDYKNTDFGNALKKHGLGQGYVEYDYIEPDILFGGNYKTVYSVSDDTLAVGLISIKNIGSIPDKFNPDGFDIEEVDYNISFTGWKLTLSYEDESVTYIPKDFDRSEKINLNKNGLEPGYEGVDGIVGIHNNPYYHDGLHQGILYGLDDYYTGAELNFYEDGTVTIVDFYGKRMKYQFLMSSYMLTLISESETAVYSKFRDNNP